LIEQKKIENKISEILKELKKDQNNSELLNDLGVGYYLKGDYVEAEIAIQKALSIKKDPKYYYNLGTVYAESGNNAEAIHSFMEAVDLNPSHIPSLNNLAEQYEISGETEKAEELFNYIVKINPGNALSHYNLGNFRLRNNDHIEAAKSYEEAIKCNPDFTEAYYNIAWILYKAKAFEESLYYVKLGLKIEPGHAELLKLEKSLTQA